MKAALLTAINQPLEIAEVKPLDLQYGQVLTRVRVSGICGAQLQEVRGEKGGHFPRMMGHEACGVVIDTGIGVKTVSKGDRVVMHWRPGSGIESEFPFYEYNGKAISTGKITTFSEYSIVSENRVTAVPNETPEELCALLGCGLSTALGTLETEAKLKMGESVLVVGCGGLGLNLIRVAKMMHATPIVASDIHTSKQAAALDAGADYFAFNGYGLSSLPPFDVIVDTSGNAGAVANTVPLLAGGGRYILVGQPKPDEMIPLKNARHFFDGTGKTFLATQGGRFQPATDIPRYIKMFKTGCLNLSSIISHRVKLDDINVGLDAVRNGDAGRVLVEMV